MVNILVDDAAAEARVRNLLDRSSIDLQRVQFFRFPTNRVWTRDYGPIFLKSDKWLCPRSTKARNRSRHWLNGNNRAACPVFANRSRD